MSWAVSPVPSSPPAPTYVISVYSKTHCPPPGMSKSPFFPFFAGKANAPLQKEVPAPSASKMDRSFLPRPPRRSRRKRNVFSNTKKSSPQLYYFIELRMCSWMKVNPSSSGSPTSVTTTQEAFTIFRGFPSSSILHSPAHSPDCLFRKYK